MEDDQSQTEAGGGYEIGELRRWRRPATNSNTNGTIATARSASLEEWGRKIYRDGSGIISFIDMELVLTLFSAVLCKFSAQQHAKT